jgi:hypothetical protein
MKKWILLSFIPSLSLGAAPIISPSTPTVTLNSSINFSANVGVTWSLAPGSLGSISAGGVYTTTASYFQANNFSQQTGCQLRPNDAVENTRIDNLPVDSSSTARIANLFTVIGSSPNITFQPTIPTNTLYQNGPTMNMNFRSTSEYNGPFVMLSTFTRLSEASVISNDPRNKDHHIVGVTSDTCHYYEIYQIYNQGVGAAGNNSDSGDQVYMNQYLLPDGSAGGGIGVDAAGMNVEPLLLHFSEIESGVINHALRCTMDNGNLYGTGSCPTGALWPAQDCTSECQDSTKCFPYGSRLRLRSAYSCANMTPRGQAICLALKQYGCFLIDGGTALGVVTAWDSVESTQTWIAQFNDFTSAVSTISSSDLQQVDESSLKISSFTDNINPANGFVTPPQFAQVIATNNSDLTVSSVSIAIVPVTVGWTNPVHQGLDTGINVMAGTPQFTIPAWVNGSTDTVFNCSMTPTVGSIATSASGCLYTAPTAQYNQVLVTTVTITSRIDPNHNAASFYVTVFSTDGIRIRMGDAISGSDTKPPYDNNGIFTDTSGNNWFEEPVNNIPPWNLRDTQGNAAWPNQMYNQHAYGLAEDKLWGFMLPNNPNNPSGNFTGTWIVTSNHGSSQACCGDVNNSTNTFETQNGRILFSSVSLITATLTPGVFISTITESTNSLYYAIRENSEGSGNFISYLSVIFSSATAPPVAASPQNLSITGPQTWTGNIKAFSQ